MDILVEGKSTGWKDQELDDEDEKSAGVLVGYSEIQEMVSQALGNTEVQKYYGLKVQIGWLPWTCPACPNCPEGAT